jgi:hypothetical protein
MEMTNTNGEGMHLAVDNSARDRAIAQFGHLSESVWAHTTREEAQRERPFLLLERVSFEGVPRISEETARRVRLYLRSKVPADAVQKELGLADERAKTIQSALLEQLTDRCNGSVLRTSSISGDEFAPIGKYLQSITTALFLRDDFGGLSPEGESLVRENIRKAYSGIADVIWRKVGFLKTREELESHLRRKGIDIYDETVTKLMLFEMNRGRTDPAILMLPNFHHPYNPLVCAVEYDRVFPELRSALSLFTFLDELPEEA